MKIELLNVRITIQKATVVVDKYGNRKNDYETCYRCYATVSAEAAKEETSAGVVVDESKIDFTVRWCQAAAAVTSTGYRIIFNGELYNILGVDHMSYKHKAVKYHCQKVSRT